MRFVAMFSYGPNWQAGKTVYQQGAPIEGHLESMRRRFERASCSSGGRSTTAAGSR